MIECNYKIGMYDCPLPASSIGSGDHCLLHARIPDKELVDFNDCLTKLIRIRHHIGRTECHLDGIYFPDNFQFPFAVRGFFSFGYASFPDGIDFKNAHIYHLGLSFHEAEFRGKALFNHATFEKKTFFEGATFGGRVDFSFANFGNVYFHSTENRRTVFDDGVDFIGTRFNGTLHMPAVIFNGLSNFVGVKIDHERILSGSATKKLTDLQFKSDAKINVVRADFTNCEFLNTDITRFEIKDAIWPYKLHYFFPRITRLIYSTRLATRDELFDRHPERLPQLEELYRNIKTAYMKKRDFDRAGEFHYAENEMKRLQFSKMGKYFSIQSVYRAASGYGGRYLRSAAVLLSMFIFFTSLFLISGIENSNSLIDYRIALYPPKFDFPSINELADASLFTLKNLFLGRGVSIFEPATSLAKFVSILASILLPSQLALFLLALRTKHSR